MWISVACFWCQSFGYVSHYVCSLYYIFSSVWVAEWPPFGKELSIRLAVCSHCILSICNFSYFPFGFESRVCFFYSPVPVYRLLVTLIFQYNTDLTESVVFKL